MTGETSRDRDLSTDVSVPLVRSRRCSSLRAAARLCKRRTPPISDLYQTLDLSEDIWADMALRTLREQIEGFEISLMWYAVAGLQAHQEIHNPTFCLHIPFILWGYTVDS